MQYENIHYFYNSEICKIKIQQYRNEIMRLYFFVCFKWIIQKNAKLIECMSLKHIIMKIQESGKYRDARFKIILKISI